MTEHEDSDPTEDGDEPTGEAGLDLAASSHGWSLSATSRGPSGLRHVGGVLAMIFAGFGVVAWFVLTIGGYGLRAAFGTLITSAVVAVSLYLIARRT